MSLPVVPAGILSRSLLFLPSSLDEKTTFDKRFQAALALLVPRAPSFRVFQKRSDPEGQMVVRTVVTAEGTEVRRRRQQGEAFISDREKKEEKRGFGQASPARTRRDRTRAQRQETVAPKDAHATRSPLPKTLLSSSVTTQLVCGREVWGGGVSGGGVRGGGVSWGGVWGGGVSGGVASGVVGLTNMVVDLGAVGAVLLLGGAGVGQVKPSSLSTPGEVKATNPGRLLPVTPLIQSWYLETRV